jgi:hypothetical protein
MREIQAPAQKTPRFFSKKVFLHAATIWLLSFGGGVVVGFAKGAGQMSTNSYFILLAASNLISLTLGGVIAGLSVPRLELGRHLQAVGLLLWISGLVNVALGALNFVQFILSVLFIVIFLALGAWISGFINKSRVKI